MSKWVLIGTAAMLVSGTGAYAAAPTNLLTASENSSDQRIGQDLVIHIARPVDIDLRAVPSKGSVENIKRLHDEPDSRMALVQADIYQAYNELAVNGNAEAARIVNSLRVIVPLYDNEIYFVARSDSNLSSISDIQDQRINIGPIGSGSAITAATLYRLMFETPISPSKVSTLSSEEALIKMVRDKTIDVVVVVAGQPSPLFLGMEPGAEKYFKLLGLAESPATTAALTAYDTGVIRAASYPAWLKKDITTLSVKTLLVTYKSKRAAKQRQLIQFTKSLCKNFSTLQNEGHPKWKDVSLVLPKLSAGWSYYTPTAPHLGDCGAGGPLPTKRTGAKCPFQDELLGLCPSL
jgi:hypothetical protein